MERAKAYFLFVLCNIIILPVYSQKNTTDSPKTLSIEASYTGDNLNNLSGGIRTGSCFLGLANFKLNLNTEPTGLWKGGQFFINAANTHGASPSYELIGDLQVASNIEAGNHTFLQELWYKQTFQNVILTLGLQDLNVDFLKTEHGSLFLNSSFGVMPTLSGNITAPIYPLTSLGFSAKWKLSESMAWSNAIFDGCPTDFDKNPHNLKWQFNIGDGFLAISEFQFTTKVKNMPVTYKMGIYSHTHFFGQNSGSMDSSCINNFGMYAIADQMLWQKGSQGLGTFLQLGYGPEKYNANYFYIGTGLNYHGLFSKKGSDVVGLAIAVAGLNNHLSSETTIELTYQIQLMKHFFIQPDLQYIINPAGLGIELANSLEGTLRFGLSF